MFGTFTELVIVPFIGWYTTLASGSNSRNLPEMLGSKSGCIVLGLNRLDIVWYLHENGCIVLGLNRLDIVCYLHRARRRTLH